MTSITASNDVLGIVLERPDLLGRRVRRRVERRVVDEQMRNAPVSDDLLERALDRRAVGHVDLERADAVRQRAGRDVEARDAHPALGEAGCVHLPELTQAAGHDGHPAVEIEERVRGHAAAARFAFQTASQNSRTQPFPPARVSTSFASGMTSAHASAGTTGSPTAARHSASFTSFPR